MAQFFSVKADVNDLIRRLNVLKKDVPFLTAAALTKTAQDIKAAELDVMMRVFDRPTRFTLGALYVKPATKVDLTAVVEFKAGFGKSVPAWRYLGPSVEGGGRAKKGHERALERAGILKADEWAVPSKSLAVDSNGNVPGSVFTRILSQVQASPDPMQNMTPKSRKRATKKVGRYFVMRGRAGVHDGIYNRAPDGRAIVPVLLFVRQPKYEKRFPFYETAKATYDQRVAPNFRAAWQRSVERNSKAVA